jgi:dihydroorotase
MTKLRVFGKAVLVPPATMRANVFIEIDKGKVQRLTQFGKDPDITADVVMPGFIDPHVHCRDWRQSHKETISSACEAAAHGGVTQIHDMPNTDPPVLCSDDVERRLETARESPVPVKYMLYAGLTGDKRQVKDAVESVRKFRQVAGLKLYAGESFGSLGVTDIEKQREIYRMLARLRYAGVLMVHCERSSRIMEDRWSVNNPETWCDTRAPEAEVEAIRDQIAFASKAGFRGHIHICHVTLPESVKVIRNAPRSLKVSCGATPHNLMLTRESMKAKSRGLYLKVNPPLRSGKDVIGLTGHLVKGDVDWIETDHAPHTINEKLNHPFCSGMPELDTFSNFAAGLNRDFGLSWSEIAMLTSMKAEKVFRLKRRGTRPGNEATLTLLDLRPETIERKNLKTKCGWSPYEGMTFPGRCKATIVSGEIAYLDKE